jgi:hypothetical protein
MEVEQFSVALQVGHLQSFFAQKETSYDEAILSQHTDYLLHDVPILIRSSNIFL